MRKIILFLGLILTISGLGFTKLENIREAKQKPIKNIEVSAKTDEYSDIDDIEKDADIVIIGKKLKNEKNIIQRDEYGGIIGTYTMSKIRIVNLIKGKERKGNEITILENEAIDKKENKIYHIDGYKKMKIGGNYLLMLKSSGEDYYFPVGAVYGKINLNEENDELYTQNMKLKENMKKIQEEAINKYRLE